MCCRQRESSLGCETVSGKGMGKVTLELEC